MAGQSIEVANKFSNKNIVVIAHRGNHLNVPENTLESFNLAIECRADYVEVDVRMTRDGIFVILHNATVDGITDGSGAVKKLTFAELRKLNIKTRSDTRKSYRIPSLEEVLQLCSGRIGIYLDFKEGEVSEAYRLIRKYGMEKTVAVYIHSEEQYNEWKTVAPDMMLIGSIPEKISLNQLDSFLQCRKIDIVDNAYSAELVDFLHQRNVSTWLDIESENEGVDIWQLAISTGADGLQTDHPEQLIEYLKNSGLR